MSKNQFFIDIFEKLDIVVKFLNLKFQVINLKKRPFYEHWDLVHLFVDTLYMDVLVSYRSLSVAPRPICIFFYSCLSHLFWPQIMVTIDTVPSKMNCTVIDMANKVRPRKYVYFFWDNSQCMQIFWVPFYLPWILSGTYTYLQSKIILINP